MFCPRGTHRRLRSCISAGRLIGGGFTLLDTQFVTDHLRQFGTIEIDRDDFHHHLDHALGQTADFLRLPLDVPGDAILDIIEQAHGKAC